MQEIFKKLDFDITINRENVFTLIDCHKESPIYDEIVEEYDLLTEQVLDAIEPTALIGFGKLPQELADENRPENAPVLYVLLTVGNKATKLSEQSFEQGDYLAGMLVDAMADDYLFQMDKEIQDTLKEICGEKRFGVSKRLDAPNEIPMVAQKVIAENTNAMSELQIGVTSGYMFTTIKTTGYILMLTRDMAIFKGQHNCENCTALNCKMRSVMQK